MEQKQRIDDLAQRLDKPFRHVILGRVDDYCAFLVRIEGAYLFHEHTKDEMYLVREGEIVIDYGDGTSVKVGPGESLVARAGEKHRSRSEEGALVLIFKAMDELVKAA